MSISIACRNDSRTLARTSWPIVTTVMVLAPTSVAYADAPAEFVRQVTSSPWHMFGMGCAAGALCGGLLVGLVNARAKRRLREQIEDMAQAAEYANMAAGRTSVALQEVEQELAELRLAHDALLAAQAAKTAATQATPAQAAVTQDVQSDDDRTQATQPMRVKPRPLSERIPHIDADEAAWLKPRDFAVAASDLAATASTTASVVRPAATPARVATAVVINAAERARIIDRRVPHFDESLFPEVGKEQGRSEQDELVQATESMEDTLSQPAQASPASDPQATSPISRRSLNESAYVDRLVQEEFELNKAGQARRYSRSHLTLYEGTGDLTAARKAAREQGRHLRQQSQEA